MSRSAALSLLVGLTVAVVLIVTNDPREILHLLLGAGWGIAAVVALRLPQILFSALGWASLIDDPRRPGWRTLVRLRWIREAVNAMLPVAQVGGDFVRAQLLLRRGVSGVAAAASVAVDLATEMAAQVVFALLGLAVLLLIPHSGGASGWTVGIVALIGILAAGFIAAQRWGLFRLVERLLQPLAGRGERAAKQAGGAAAGLHDAVVRLHRAPRRLWLSGMAHLASWLLGTLETWAAMRLLGIEGAGLEEALVIESLGQAVRSLGFMIPGALGVQEGGSVLVCALFGIPPEQAIALALIRRIRDVTLGLPGIVAWRWAAMAGPETRPVAATAPGRILR